MVTRGFDPPPTMLIQALAHAQTVNSLRRCHRWSFSAQRSTLAHALLVQRASAFLPVCSRKSPIRWPKQSQSCHTIRWESCTLPLQRKAQTLNALKKRPIGVRGKTFRHIGHVIWLLRDHCIMRNSCTSDFATRAPIECSRCSWPPGRRRAPAAAQPCPCGQLPRPEQAL